MFDCVVDLEEKKISDLLFFKKMSKIRWKYLPKSKGKGKGKGKAKGKAEGKATGNGNSRED